MALVNVEVVCRTLVLSGGLTLQPGERFGLDPDNPEHATIIERGWVRVCPPTLSSPVTSVLKHPPNKQVRRRQTRRKKA